MPAPLGIDAIALLPEKVRVGFPARSGGKTPCPCSGVSHYVVDVTPADLTDVLQPTLEPYGAWPLRTYPGEIHVVRSRAMAVWSLLPDSTSGGDPEGSSSDSGSGSDGGQDDCVKVAPGLDECPDAPLNAEDLEALARVIARDFYLWRAAPAWDVIFPGTIEWAMEGTTDLVSWSYRPDESRTHVRSVLPALVEIQEFLHATPEDRKGAGDEMEWVWVLTPPTGIPVGGDPLEASVLPSVTVCEVFEENDDGELEAFTCPGRWEPVYNFGAEEIAGDLLVRATLRPRPGGTCYLVVDPPGEPGSGSAGGFDRCDCPEDTYEVEVDCGSCTGPRRNMPKYWYLDVSIEGEGSSGAECVCSGGGRILLEYVSGCSWAGEGGCLQATLEHDGSAWVLTVTDETDCVLLILELPDEGSSSGEDGFACCAVNSGWERAGGDCEGTATLTPHECTCCPPEPGPALGCGCQYEIQGGCTTLWWEAIISGVTGAGNCPDFDGTYQTIENDGPTITNGICNWDIHQIEGGGNFGSLTYNQATGEWRLEVGGGSLFITLNTFNQADCCGGATGLALDTIHPQCSGGSATFRNLNPDLSWCSENA